MRKIKYISIILASLLITSCVLTEKQKTKFLAKNCVGKDSISYIIKDSIVYKDTVINVPFAINEPIYIESPCDSLGQLKPINSTISNNGLRSTVKSKGNVLIFNCETDSLKARIKYLEHNKIIESNKSTEIVIQKDCERAHKSKFDGFTFWYFWITICILLLIIAKNRITSRL